MVRGEVVPEASSSSKSIVELANGAARSAFMVVDGAVLQTRSHDGSEELPAGVCSGD